MKLSTIATAVLAITTSSACSSEVDKQTLKNVQVKQDETRACLRTKLSWEEELGVELVGEVAR